MARLIEVDCWQCRGTGKLVDFFSPPASMFEDQCGPVYIPRTWDGYRIRPGETCPFCRGRGSDLAIVGSAP